VEAKVPSATVGTTLTIEPPIPVAVGNPAFIVLKLVRCLRDCHSSGHPG
jgi:hypothetical protein